MAQQEEWFSRGCRVLARTPEGEGLVAEAASPEDAKLMAAAPSMRTELALAHAELVRLSDLVGETDHDTIGKRVDAIALVLFEAGKG